MIENPKKGQTVYRIEEYTDFIERGKVANPTIKRTEIGGTVYSSVTLIDWNAYVDADGKVGRDSFGSSGCNLSNLFISATEADANRRIRNKKKFREYYDSIQSVEDLVKFPLNHMIYGEDRNYYAIIAYLVKSKEILGVTDIKVLREYKYFIDDIGFSVPWLD